jgi:hypothetical protein
MSAHMLRASKQASERQGAPRYERRLTPDVEQSFTLSLLPIIRDHKMLYDAGWLIICHQNLWQFWNSYLAERYNRVWNVVIIAYYGVIASVCEMPSVACEAMRDQESITIHK